MIKMPENNGLTKIYDEPIYVEEKFDDVPFSYYKITCQSGSGYYMGTVVHFGSGSGFPFIGKIAELPSHFTDEDGATYYEVNEEIYQAAFDQVLEEL